MVSFTLEKLHLVFILIQIVMVLQQLFYQSSQVRWCCYVISWAQARSGILLFLLETEQYLAMQGEGMGQYILALVSSQESLQELPEQAWIQCQCLWHSNSRFLIQCLLPKHFNDLVSLQGSWGFPSLQWIALSV